MDADFDDTHNPDLQAHERTYHAFNVLLRWCMLLLAVAISTLTLWFATPAGFWGGTVVGLALFAAGWWFLVRAEARKPLNPWGGGR